MKLITYYKDLLVEDYVVDTIEKGDNKIVLSQTHHQRFDRMGQLPVPENLISLVGKNKKRLGVNTEIIKLSISKHFNNLFFLFINQDNYKKILVTDSYDVKKKIYIEYLIQGKRIDLNTIKIKIITSSFAFLPEGYLNFEPELVTKVNLYK